ncbi:hypothetical protein Godav_025454, partial [Gossypium davidsonii]|nr:hypothetical protein [Gossypium davidsonii]
MSRPHHAGCVVEAGRELYVCGEFGSLRCLLSHEHFKPEEAETPLMKAAGEGPNLLMVKP